MELWFIIIFIFHAKFDIWLHSRHWVMLSMMVHVRFWIKPLKNKHHGTLNLLINIVLSLECCAGSTHVKKCSGKKRHKIDKKRIVFPVKGKKFEENINSFYHVSVQLYITFSNVFNKYPIWVLLIVYLVSCYLAYTFVTLCVYWNKYSDFFIVISSIILN